jgi:hypothetical protein
VPLGVPTLKYTKVGRSQKKNLGNVPLQWCKPDYNENFYVYIFISGYLSSRHPVNR